MESLTLTSTLVLAKLFQVCLILCEPMDCSLSRDSPGKNTGVKVAMPSPGDLPDLGMELASLKSPALGDGSLPPEPPGKPTLGLITTRSVGKADAIEKQVV